MPDLDNPDFWKRTKLWSLDSLRKFVLTCIYGAHTSLFASCQVYALAIDFVHALTAISVLHRVYSVFIKFVRLQYIVVFVFQLLHFISNVQFIIPGNFGYFILP